MAKETLVKTPINTCILLAFVCAMAWVGCKKHTQSNPADPNAAQPAGLPSAAASQPPPQAVVANAQNSPASGIEGQVDPFLTQQLQIFIRQKQRMPQSFAELAAARLDSVPRAPDGYKWVIDTASSQVKAAKTQ